MAIERRTFLKYAVAGCACCALPGLAGADEHAAPHWSYEGATGPDHWGGLSPEFQVCRLGTQQTPVDLSSVLTGEASIAVDYRPAPLRLVNNGHTVEAAACPDCAVTIDGTRYGLAQFHFHHPSEHLIDGKAFDMEAHLVHRSAEGSLAVVGVFMKAGAHNTALGALFDHLPQDEGREVFLAERFDPAALLPANRSGFRYMGSLTTPPCSEGLVWTVFREPIEVSPDQIRTFAALFPNNARPVQRTSDQLLQAGELRRR